MKIATEVVDDQNKYRPMLKTNYIVKTAREYYNCQKITGMKIPPQVYLLNLSYKRIFFIETTTQIIIYKEE